MTRPAIYLQRLWRGRHSGLCDRLVLPLLAVPAAIYATLICLRAWAYARGLFTVHRLPRPVISIGNITVGGTGKTPVTAWIARYLLEQGLRVAVLSRGYGGSLEGQTAIVSDGQTILLGPDQCGDEPYLLACTIPGLLVVVGSDRYRAGQLALEQLAPDCFLLDDGFQHLRLYRDLNILLLDCTNPLGNGRVVPAGPLRELPRARQRADLLVFTRCHDDSQIAWDMAHVPQCRTQHRLASFRMLANGHELRSEQLRRGKVVACAGIANPAAFFENIRQCSIPLAATLALEDHAIYDAATLASMERLLAETGAEWLLTTEKDGVKLQQRVVGWLPRVVTACLELQFDDDRILRHAVTAVFKQPVGMV